jgi:DNA-binding transcriptional regulator YhcF (GntR family)
MAKPQFKIDEQAGRTKIQQLVHSISEAIANGLLKNGDMLPSVNQLSAESGFSRDTVFKAYNLLKQRNLIESVPTKGYFVAGDSFKVFMLLDDFSAFKEQLYQSFRSSLPDSYAVDLLFHHYNPEVFTQLIENSLGRYSMYVVMNIDAAAIHPILHKIDPNKLLVLDMGRPVNDKMNYLLQDFNESLTECLEQGVVKLKKYSEMVLVYDEKTTPHPSTIVSAVNSFCVRNNIAFSQVHSANSDRVKANTAYFVIRDSDLVEVIKSCRTKRLTLGTDVGVLSYNDTPMKQIVGGGITVISTNFEKMGREAAGFVKNKKKVAKVLATSLILRDSI